jgi:polyisoprenoid-binding protein YceI
MVKRMLFIVVVVVAVAGAALWWFVLRDDAPPRAEITASDCQPSGDTSSADGMWTVAPGEGVFVGYRINELFANETVKKTAAGRTPAVEGTVVVEGARVPQARFEADLTRLESDRDRRDNALETRGLETSKFPTAEFVLTRPIDLGRAPVPGRQSEVIARGDLTLHGVTREVDVTLRHCWAGDTVELAGSAPVVLADFDMTPPDVLGMLEVDDEGELEVQLTLTR